MAQAPLGEPDVFARQLSKNKGKKRIWKRILLGFAGLVVVFLAVVAFIFRHDPEDLTGAIISAGNDNLIFDSVGQDKVNILVVGEDYNWKNAKVFNPHTGKYAPYHVVDLDSAPRSDSMILVSLDKDSRTVRVLSMPRDAEITYTDDNGDTHHAQKFNSVYANGGINPKNRELLLRRVIHDELGVRVDRFIALRPDGFKKLVDMVGGVDVNVDGALKRDHDTGKMYRGHIHYKDEWGEWEVDLSPGFQHLDGDQAHGYVRFREDLEGDTGRIRRQQEVAKALAKAVQHTHPWDIPTLVSDMQKEIMTDLDTGELLSVGRFAQSLGDASKIQPLTLYGISTDNGDVILNRPKNKKLLAAIFGDSFDPKHFLVRSPSTTKDTIGPSNNSNPEGIAFLKAAGLFDDRHSSLLTVEVRSDADDPDAAIHHGTDVSPKIAGDAGQDFGTPVPLPTLSPTEESSDSNSNSASSDSSDADNSSGEPVKHHHKHHHHKTSGDDSGSSDAGSSDAGSGNSASDGSDSKSDSNSDNATSGGTPAPAQ